MDEPLRFHFYEAPATPLLEEGATSAWLYEWSGEPGAARGRPVVALVDCDGTVLIESDGDWQDVTVVDDGV